MTDLRIDDATTTGAVAGLRAAANKLAPVIRAIRALYIEVVGANALAGSVRGTPMTVTSIGYARPMPALGFDPAPGDAGSTRPKPTPSNARPRPLTDQLPLVRTELAAPVFRGSAQARNLDERIEEFGRDTRDR